MKIPDPRERLVGLLALFGAGGTLVCCALPIVLVMLGMGAAVTALTAAAPWLILSSQNKLWVFSLSALVLVLSAWLTFRRARECPTDPEALGACARARRWNRRILWASVSIWTVGFFAAYFLLPLVRWIDGRP